MAPQALADDPQATPLTVVSNGPSPIPPARPIAPQALAPQTIYPTALISQPPTETSFSQTWATYDQALVLSGLREIVSSFSRQDEDIISIDDDFQPQLSPPCSQISPRSSLPSYTQKGDKQKTMAENEKTEGRKRIP